MAPMEPVGPLNPLGVKHTQHAVHTPSEEDKVRAYMQGTNDRARGNPYGTGFTGKPFGDVAQAYREGFNAIKGERK